MAANDSSSQNTSKFWDFDDNEDIEPENIPQEEPTNDVPKEKPAKEIEKEEPPRTRELTTNITRSEDISVNASNITVNNCSKIGDKEEIALGKQSKDECILNKLNYMLFKTIYQNDKTMIVECMGFKHVEFKFKDADCMVKMKYNDSHYEKNSLKLALLNLTNLWQNKILTINDVQKKYLSSSDGSIYISKFNNQPLCKRGNMNIYACLGLSDSLKVVTNAEDGIDLAKKKLNSELHTEIISLQPEEIKLVKGDKWENVIEEYKAKVFMSINKDKIEILGSSELLDAFKTAIEQFFKSESRFSKDIEMTEGQWKLFQIHQDKFANNEVEIDFDEDNLKVKISGMKQRVLETVHSIDEEYMKQIEVHTFDIDQIGLKADLFQAESGSYATDILRILSVDHKCYIHVTDTEKIKKDENKTHGDSGGFLSWLFNTVCANVTRANLMASPSAEDQQNPPEQNNFKVLSGNLVQCTDCDVLVNAISGSKQNLIHNGKIAKSFSQACGKELLEDLEAKGFPDNFGGNVVETKAFGNVKCKKIFHVYISKNENWRSSELMKRTILSCLKATADNNYKSIAFPTLGCGKLGYIPEQICSCFTKAYEEFCQMYPTKMPLNIVIYAFEDAMAARLKNRFQQGKEENDKSSGDKTSLKKHMPVDFEERILNFTVYSLGNSDMTKIEMEMKDKIKTLSFETSFTHDLIPTIEDISEEAKNKLREIYSRISIKLVNGMIHLSGLTNDVNSARDQIINLLDNEKKNLNNIDYIRKIKKGPALLNALFKMEISLIPTYWNLNKNNSTANQDVIKSELDPNNKLFKAVSDMVMKTWIASKAGGVGRDATGLNHTNIEIRKIYLIQNLTLFKKYANYVKIFAEQITNGKINKLQEEPMTYSKDCHLCKTLISEMNEYFLFHGTKDDIATVLIKEGFDNRLCENAMLGKGTYFAESSTKADQYTDSKKTRAADGTILTMFLCRVLLGNAHDCVKPKSFNRPPCIEPGCTKEDKCSSHQNCNSVIGTHAPDGRKLWFREFVVYELNNCYPEFWVDYVRKK